MHKFSLKFFFMLGCACLSIFLICSAAGAGQESGAGQNIAFGDGLVMGSIGDATSMIPMLTSDTASSEMSGHIYNGLLKYDKDLNLVGDLAESWSVSDDGLSIIFKLKNNVRFHDGRLYTSRDAVFNWEFMVDPNTPTAYSGHYLEVDKVEAPDDYTFKAHYRHPFAPGLASWTLPQMPSHLFVKGQDPRLNPLNRNPIGTGPYRFKEWIAGSQVSLCFYENYFEGRPYLDNLVFRVIPDMATLFLELRSNGIDMMSLTPLQYRRQTSTAFFNENFHKYQYLSSSYTFVGWNLRDPRFQDVRVRRALTHAIDKEEIIKGVLLGLGQVATGPMKPGTFWHNPQVSRYPYNPQKSLALFKEAGWEKAADGRLRNAQGIAFDFVLITNQGNQARQNSAVILQRRLADIGIKVDIRVIEWAAFLKEFVNKGRFDAILLGWTIPPDPDLYTVFHSSNIDPGKLNITAYQNSEVDQLTEAGRRTVNRDRRKAVYDRVQEILAEDQPYTFLYAAQALPIVNARFQGITPAPAGITHNMIRWHVPLHLQQNRLQP